MNATKTSRALRSSLALTAALLLAAPAAFGAELTREEYVARVEPICKANTEANARIFKGAKEEVKAGELKRASARFTRATAAFEKTIEQLKAIPQPAADATKLGKWIGFLEVERSFLAKIGKALAAEQKSQAQVYLVRLTRNSTLANNAVLGFGFQYCQIDPSRFS